MKIQALGITRWSYPGTAKHYREAPEALDVLRAKLYAPHRLELRLFLLEHLLLPCLRAQTDPDFSQLFVAGDSLPDPWRSRLLELVGTVPQAKVVFAPDGQDIQDLLNDILDAHRDPDCDVIAQYRIDDDDAVAASFVEKTRRQFAAIAAFYAPEEKAALDFTRGFILETEDSGIDLRPVIARQWAPGLIIYQPAATARSVFDFPHLRVWSMMPTVALGGVPMFIRGAHHDNDSHLDSFARRTKTFNFNPRSKRRNLQRRFGIDTWEMNDAWLAQKHRFFDPDVSDQKTG